MTPLRRPLVIAVTGALLVLAACAPGGPAEPAATSTAPAATAPPQDSDAVAFTTYEVPWVDTNRPTEPLVAGAAASDRRALPTTVRVPDGDGPLPAVVFAHGLGSSPQRFTGLLDAWAAAGYVVVAPRFPLTSDANPDHDLERDDQVNLPADVSFVIDRVLAASGTPGDPLEGRVDPDAIGAAGFSLGGGATYALAFNDTFRDERLRSVAILASAVLFDALATDLARSFPLLIVHSTTDEQLPYEFAVDAFDLAGGPTWFVTLDGFNHHDPFDDVPTPVDATVEEVTTAFWDLTLGGAGEPALVRLADSVASSGGLATLQTRGP